MSGLSEAEAVAEVWAEWVRRHEPALPPEWWALTQSAAAFAHAAGKRAGAVEALTDAADDPFLRVKFIDSWGNVRQWLRDRVASLDEATA